MRKKIIIRIILILLVAVLMILVSRFFAGPTPKQWAPISVKQQKELFENFDVFINDNPLSDRLSFDDFKNGFWYRKKAGNSEDIFFFDTSWMIEMGLSKEEILSLIKQLLPDVVIVKKEKMKMVTSKKLPDDLQFHNSLYKSILDKNYNEIKNSLLDKKNKTAQDYIKLSEIFGLEGNYQEKEKYLKIACELDSKIKFCKTSIIKIFGQIIDQNGRAVPEAEIKIISDSQQKSVLSTSDGLYTLEIDMHLLQKNRISVSKIGHASTFYGFTVFSENKKEYQIPDIILYEGIDPFIIDNIKKTITADGKYENGYFIIKTEYSKYSIPEDAFYLDEKKYSGKIYAYLYDFNRETMPQSLMSLDVFSPVAGFVGTSMLTFGMPYITFQTEDGKTLYVKNNKPMILEYQSPILKKDFEAFQDDPKFIQEIEEIIALTRDNKQLLTREYISEYNLPWPPFWVLDQKTGVWQNVPFQILNRNGLYKMDFYTTIR